MGKGNILLIDNDQPESRPLSRFRTIFSQRNGIYTEIERMSILYPRREIYFKHPNVEYELIVSKINVINSHYESLDSKRNTDSQFEIIYKSDHLNPVHLIKSVGYQIEEDLKLIRLDFFNNKKYNVVGKREHLFVHNLSTVLDGCIFDTREGAIIIDEHAKVSPFSFLSGPLYIGKHAHIDNAKIYGGCIIGNYVKVGGEIENSIINDFSNKHHEGFLGHSILGSWVNLGALTTTSDLKNNYGIIRVNVPQSFFPSRKEPLITSSTNEIKFGSVIGDCVKTAVGTVLNTGTILDCGSNVFGGNPGKYLIPFSWGFDGSKLYEASRFIEDCKVIFKRRGQYPHKLLDVLVSNIMKHL